jgi:hypothetical protein
MTITALPSAPLPTDNTATFNSKAFALVAALNTFVTQANAVEAAVDADAVTVSASSTTASNASAAAVGAANFKGEWSTLTGALSIPASVSYNSKVWILTVSVSNVAAEVPGVSTKWIAALNLASPGPIGGTTPSSGVFTTLADQYGNVRAVPQSGAAKTASYTIATADVGRFINLGASGAITIPNSTFAAGDIVSLFNNTAAAATITCSTTNAYIAGTDTNKTSVTLATRGVATILFITSTLCVISGNVS